MAAITIAGVRAEVDRRQAVYSAAIEKLAAQVRRERVIPFCRKYRLRYSAGMGTWGFWRVGTDTHAWISSHDPGPAYARSLWDLLHVEVERGGIDLGSYIRDVKAEDLEPGK